MAFDSMIQVRLEERDKVMADELFSSLGLETSTAIRMFIKRAIKLQSFPFDISEKISSNEEMDEEESEFDEMSFSSGSIDLSKNYLELVDVIYTAFGSSIEHQFLQKHIKRNERANEYFYALLKYWILRSGRDLGFLVKDIRKIVYDANNVSEEINMVDVISILDYVEEALPIKQRWLNRIHVPIILYVGELAKGKGISSDEFGIRITKFFETKALEKEFRESSSNGNAKKDRVQKRLEVMLTILD